MIGLILQSRTARSLLAAAAVLAGVLVWHQANTASRVRKALAEYVASAELTAARVQMEELRRRQSVSDKARRRLQSEIEEANAQATAAVEELEHYVSAVEENCVVRPELVERMRQR
jgi:VIT1/CCC1 family predicted Fe2+/Mn2+ transporter